jgi:nitrogen fixation protein NifB
MNFSGHPCFDENARKCKQRIHLPVAPKCNMQCNYCNKKFDCANENRPGVSSTIMSPLEAFHVVKKLMEENGDSIGVVGIAGPGDPLSNPKETFTTFQLVHEVFPDLLLCLATNGVNVKDHIYDIACMEISHVTVTMNAIDPKIGAKIYDWVNTGTEILSGLEGAEYILERQLTAIQLLKEFDIVVKVNSVLVPGINDAHMELVAQKCAELKVDIFNCIPYLKNSDCKFSNVEEPSPNFTHEIRSKLTTHLPQMKHCQRCRADAIGFLK